MESLKENFSKLLEGDKKNFIILFLVFFSTLVLICYSWISFERDIKKISYEEIKIEKTSKLPQILSGTIESLDKENFTLIFKVSGNSLNVAMNEETRIYLESPKNIEDFAVFLSPKEGVKKLETGKGARIIFVAGGTPNLLSAQEIWLE